MQIADQAVTTYTDATASPDSTYSYTVVALDAAGNASPPSAAATVSTTGAPDGTPPTQPGNVTATAMSSSHVNLTWSASTDNVGVMGYNVYRNRVPLPSPTVPDPTAPVTYSDDTAEPGTTYTYAVSAVDAAGNESTKGSATATTQAGGGGGGRTLTYGPTDDSTVDSSQATVNFGTNTRLTVDNSPQNFSLLKFNVTGTTGCTIIAAKTSSVATTVALNTSYQFDVKPLITGDGVVSMLIKSTSSDGARYYSKEGGTTTQAPQLQLTCG